MCIIVGVFSLAINSPFMEHMSEKKPLYIETDYTFTENISVPIVVVANNLVIDGNHYRLDRWGVSFGISLKGRSNVTIMNVKIQSSFGHDYGGILLENATNNRITANIITDTTIGIRLLSSSNNWLVNNTLRRHGSAVQIWSSSNNTISRNDIDYQRSFGSANNGILLGISTNNWLTGNLVSHYKFAIWLRYASQYNSISGNWIAQNGVGIKLDEDSSYNRIYHNNLIQNGFQTTSYNSTKNIWYHPVLLEGNYWSDYPGIDDGSGYSMPIRYLYPPELSEGKYPIVDSDIGIDKHKIVNDGIGDTHIPWHNDFYPFIQENGWLLTISELEKTENSFVIPGFLIISTIIGFCALILVFQKSLSVEKNA